MQIRSVFLAVSLCVLAWIGYHMLTWRQARLDGYQAVTMSYSGNQKSRSETYLHLVCFHDDRIWVMRKRFGVRAGEDSTHRCICLSLGIPTIWT